MSAYYIPFPSFRFLLFDLAFLRFCSSMVCLTKAGRRRLSGGKEVVAKAARLQEALVFGHLLQTGIHDHSSHLVWRQQAPLKTDRMQHRRFPCRGCLRPLPHPPPIPPPPFPPPVTKFMMVMPTTRMTWRTGKAIGTFNFLLNLQVSLSPSFSSHGQ